MRSNGIHHSGEKKRGGEKGKGRRERRVELGERRTKRTADCEFWGVGYDDVDEDCASAIYDYCNQRRYEVGSVASLSNGQLGGTGALIFLCACLSSQFECQLHYICSLPIEKNWGPKSSGRGGLGCDAFDSFETLFVELDSPAGRF